MAYRGKKCTAGREREKCSFPEIFMTGFYDSGKGKARVSKIL
jgi:hypothetical protein